MRGKNPASATGARAYLNASNALMSAGEEMSAGTPPPRGGIAPARREVAPNRAPSLWSRRVGTRQSHSTAGSAGSRDRDSQTRRRSGGESPRRFRMASSPRRITKAFFHRPAATKKRKPRELLTPPNICRAPPASAMATVSARGAASAFFPGATATRLPRQMRGHGVRWTRSGARSRAPRTSPGANVRACHLCVGGGASSLLPRRRRACPDRPAPFKSASSRGDDARTEEADGEKINHEDPLEDAEEPIATRVALGLIRFYRTQISPLTPPSCRFVPTCSQYAMTAFRTFGPAKGFVLTAWRILRCNPWGGVGYDPPRWPPVGVANVAGDLDEE
jgi:putative membrane protein insertion efficiency factor